eukprot:705734-Rhodomonas_salina.4
MIARCSPLFFADRSLDSLLPPGVAWGGNVFSSVLDFAPACLEFPQLLRGCTLVPLKGRNSACDEQDLTTWAPKPELEGRRRGPLPQST